MTQVPIDRVVFEINQGLTVQLTTNSANASLPCLAQLFNTGWVVKVVTLYNTFWEWHGPCAVMVDGNLIMPGGATTPTR